MESDLIGFTYCVHLDQNEKELFCFNLKRVKYFFPSHVFLIQHQSSHQWGVVLLSTIIVNSFFVYVVPSFWQNITQIEIFTVKRKIYIQYIFDTLVNLYSVTSYCLAPVVPPSLQQASPLPWCRFWMGVMKNRAVFFQQIIITLQQNSCSWRKPRAGSRWMIMWWPNVVTHQE